MRSCSRAAFAVLGLVLVPASAWAGGFEVGDHGAQAVGRGTAFVAKADDPTAIHYNPAGLARQRGTKIYAAGNIFFHSFEFRRSGSYPDDPNDPATPWGGRPFPAVSNSAGAFLSPFLALTSDFGTFDRLTFAFGVYGPSAIGNRTFPLAVDQAPASSRYDFVQSRSTVVYPTASAAYRVTRWLDLGISGHLAIAKFDETNVSYTDLGTCKNVEYQPCDSRSTLTASATTFAATFGAMLRPSENIALGLSVRTPIGFQAQGTVTPEPPRIANIQLEPGAATLYMDFPLVARVGARYIALDQDFEVYDLEADLVYEQWGKAQGQGPVVVIPQLGQFSNLQTNVVHHYKDTFSIRGGGAYNLDAFDGVLALRAGGWFETPATDYADTRVDFDTLAKVAGTLGVGYRNGAVQVDAAYAAIASVPRVVGVDAGDVRPINGAKNGASVDNNDQPLPAVNEGAYRGFTHILSIGITVTIDSFFGPMRPIRYGNAYEPGVRLDGEEPKREREREKEKTEEPKPEKPVEETKPEKAERPEKPEKPERNKPPPDTGEEEPPPPPRKKRPPEPPPEETKPPPPPPPPPPKKEEPKKKEWWEELD